MNIKQPLLKLLAKTYEPSTVINQSFGQYDLAIKTDDKGRPILLFIGKKQPNGNIKGERYARRLKIDDVTGAVIKDHWEHKGPATP